MSRRVARKRHFPSPATLSIESRLWKRGSFVMKLDPGDGPFEFWCFISGFSSLLPHNVRTAIS